MERNRQTGAVLDRLARRRARRQDATIRSEHERAVAEPHLLNQRHALERLALATAVAVHVLTAALFGGAVAIWFTDLTGVVKVLVTVLLTAIGIVVAPIRLRHRAEGWNRNDAPQLFALIDAIATQLAMRAPRRLLVTPDYDVTADVRTMRVGLPLWSALSPQARHALLAYAVALTARDDPRAAPVFTSATASIGDWLYLLQPDSERARRRRPIRTITGLVRPTSSVGISELLLPVALAPLFLSVHGLRLAIAAGLLPGGQRAGYRAIARAVSVAGVDGVIELLTALLMHERVGQETSLAVRRGNADLVDVARLYLAVLEPNVREAVLTNSRKADLQPRGDGPPPALLTDFVAATASATPVSTPVEAIAAADSEMQRDRDDLNHRMRELVQAELDAASHHPR